MRSVKAFVTGGTGFVGKKLVRKLEQKNADVTVFSRRCGGDITNYGAVRRAMRGADAVFHLAASKDHFATTPAALEKLHNANVVGTQNVLRAAIDNGVDSVVITSSTAVLLPSDALTSYGLSKIMMERAARKYANDVCLCVLRPPFIYDADRLRPVLGKRFPMPHKDFSMHMVYSDKLTDAFIQASRKKARGVFTIADAAPVSSLALYETLMREQGFAPFYVPGKLTDVALGFSKIAKNAAKLFGVRPPVTPEFIRMTFADLDFDTKPAQRAFGYKPADTLKTIKNIIKNEKRGQNA